MNTTYELCLLLNADLLVFILMYKYKIKFINIMFFDIIILLFVLKNTIILYIFLTLIIQIQLIPINLFKAFMYFYPENICDKILLPLIFYGVMLPFTALVFMFWLASTIVALFIIPIYSVTVIFTSFYFKNHYFAINCTFIFMDFVSTQYKFLLTEKKQQCMFAKKILQTFDWIKKFEKYFKNTEHFKFLFNNSPNAESVSTPQIPLTTPQIPATTHQIPLTTPQISAITQKIESEIKKYILQSINKKFITIEDIENLEPLIFTGIIFLILINLKEKELSLYPLYIRNKYNGNIKMTNEEKECAGKFIFNKELNVNNEQLKQNISNLMGFSIEISRTPEFIRDFSIVILQKEEFLRDYLIANEIKNQNFFIVSGL